jgi:tripartite-type tricarboxylate transporter receptor subunit TctC
MKSTLVSALLLAVVATGAEAEGWPTKSLRVIVPVGAGSTTDIIPRIVLEQLSQQLGQTIVVENRTGAGGTIGSAFVAKADADGYTLLAHSNAHTIAPSLYPSLGYHPAHDFASVVPLGMSASILVVAPSKGWRTAVDFVTAAKAKPGGIDFSSVGIGTATHLSAERFRLSAGLKAQHIPFRGGAEAMSEVMAGRVDFFFAPVGLALSHIREGKLVALAVNSAKRVAAAPDIPTLQEAGFENTEYPIWFGLFLPAQTPREIVEKLHRETVNALQAPKVKEKLATLGVEPLPMSPTEFAALVERDVALNAALVRDTGLKAN